MTCPLRQTVAASVRLRRRAAAIVRQNRVTPDRHDPVNLRPTASGRLLRRRTVRCLGASRTETRGVLAAEATGTVRRQVPRCRHAATQVVTVADTRGRRWICTSRSFVAPLLVETAGIAVPLATAVPGVCRVTVARMALRVTAGGGTSAVVEEAVVTRAVAAEVMAAGAAVTAAAVIASLEKLLRMK